jgi:hypothetical protein
LKVGNYRYLSDDASAGINVKKPIPDEKSLQKKSVESLIALWHDAHDNDRYKQYYETIYVPNYFIFPSDYKSVVSILKEIDFNELLVMISPVTARESLSEEEREKLDRINSETNPFMNHGTVN